MVKSTIVTPIYISVAWLLMIAHQVFTETAMITLADRFQLIIPRTASILESSLSIFVFIYSFAWVFLLTSIIPTKLLGKERSVFIQFIVVLAITFLSSSIEEVIIGAQNIGLIEVLPLSKELLPLSIIFKEPIYASLYLFLPFILMLIFDLYCNISSNEKQNDKREQDRILISADLL